MVSIELLLVAQGLEVGFDGERNNRRRVVCKILGKRLRIYTSRHAFDFLSSVPNCTVEAGRFGLCAEVGGYGGGDAG